MAFDNAKRILTNEDARIASSAEGIYDDDLVVLFWENVEAHHIDECVRYLNDTGQRVVSSGTTFYDVTFNDALHHLHAYYQETDQRIYRVLMRSSITTSSITQTDTKWRLQSGETYEAGTSNLVLAMYNVDPNSIVSLETESLNETYTSIYLLGGTELTGTWFNVARESEYNSQTGLYDLRWYISRYQTKEYIFATKGDRVTNTVDFFKHHMTASSIDDFESNYYFDSSTLGDYYYSTNGTSYTKKNDVAATGSLPFTAKNITTEVSGRSVSYEQRPDRENGEVDIFLKLIFNQELSSTANSDFQEYTETVVRTRNALSVDAVGTPADGTQVTIEANVNDDGTFDVLKRTRVFNQQSATSGSTNAFQSESVVITNNASAEADAPSDQSDGTIVRSESEQLPNGKFRNIVRTTVARTDVGTVTDELTTGNDSGAGFTETTVKKYNQSAAETINSFEDEAGTTVTVENTINEDGTFNTIKRTRVERQAQAASGTKGVLSSEAVVITNNAASALAQANSTTAGTTKIHESQQLENGLFRNIQRTITSHANDGSTDKVDQTGSSETILRKYNQATALVHDASEEADGTTITIENTINSDGTFNTVKRTRVDSELEATGGSANAFRNEVVTITINADAELDAPSDPSDGVSTIHESEQLPNGLFRNTVRTITARTDVATVADERSSGADNGAGFTEVITKKYNQSTAESVGENDDGAGKTVTVENTINEDGTFNTVKSIRTDRESTATSGSDNALKSETVVITNNASSALGAPGDQSDGTILIHESEQLSNGLYRNIQRTITSKAISDINDETVSGDGTNAGYTESIIKEYNKTTEATLSGSDTGVGKTSTVENIINEDGTFNTIKRIRTDRSRSAAGGSANNNFTETRTVTINASSAAGSPTHEDGKVKINESEQLENGLFRNTEIVRTFSDIADITDKEIVGTEAEDGGGYTETVTKQYKQSSALAHDTNEDAAGRTITIENTIREDGTFDIVKRVRDERNQEARADSESAASTTVIQIENNAPQELGQLVSELQPDPGVTITQESIPLDNGLFRNIKTTVTAKSQTALNKTISGKDPHLFFNGYNSYLEFENTEYQQQQKVGTYLIDFEFPEDYKPICIADGLGDFDLNNAEPLSNKVYLFSTIDGEFLGESTIDQEHLRNAVHVYLRTGERNDTIDPNLEEEDVTSEDQLNVYLVVKVRHDEYPQGELQKTVKWNHGQRRIRIAYSADCLGYTSYDFGRRPRFVIENVPASSGTPTAAYNTASGIITDVNNSGVNIDHENAKNHTMFPFRVGSGYYGGDSEASGSTDAERVSLRSEKFLLYSFHYYNCYLEDTELQAWCDSKTLPAFQPTLSIDPSLGSNIIDSEIKDIALKEEYRQGRTIVAGEPYRIEDVGNNTTGLGQNSGVNSTSDYQYYPGRAQVIIPESETSNTGERTSYGIESASRVGDTITINLFSSHGQSTNSTWEPTQVNARIIVVGLSGAFGLTEGMAVNPNKKYNSASGSAVTITFTDDDTLEIEDTGITNTGSEDYTIKEHRSESVGAWFKAGASGDLGSSVLVAPDYIPDTTRFHNATVIGDVFVAGGSREETVEINTSNTEQKFITDGGTVADPKSGEEKSIVNEVLPDGKYRTTITTRKSKLQSAVSEISSDSESSTTTINLRNVKQETAEASVPGKIVTVENTPNEDGTFRTSKTITTAKSQTATSGSTNALRSETVVIDNNASSALGAPDDQSDGTIKIHESEELPNGLFRNITRTIVARTDVATVTDETTVGDDDDAGYTETVVKKYNQSSPETLGTADDASGRTVVVENIINEDGTFNTIKRTRNDRSRSAISGTVNNNYREIVTITTNAPSALGTPNHEDGKIKIHESEQLENGKYRNVSRIRTFSNIATITDKTVSGNEGGAGYTETILKKYKQDTELHVGENEDVAGTTITIENTIREDGKFDTIKRTRVDRESEASSGTKGVLTSETVTITNNASSELAQDSTATVGQTKINTSEQLENGRFRNVARVITSHANDGSTDEINQTGSSEEIVKKYNQSSPLSHTQSEEADGKTITVENTINPDGTYNTIKRIRTDAELTATSGSTNAFRSESVVITNNAASQLDAPNDQNDGTIVIHESEQLPNGLFRNIQRTITSRTDVASVEDTIISGDDSGSGYTEVITKKYNQANAETVNSEDAAGKTIVIENTINEDGKYNTIKRVRTDRSTAATAISKSAGANTTVVITNNDSAAATPSDPAAGTTVVTESIPLENGKFRNVVTTTTAANITGSTDLRVGGTDSYSESTEIFTSSSEKTFGSNAATQVAEPSAGQIKSISNEPLADGKFRTVVTTRNIADKEYFYKFIENEYTIKTEIVFKNVDKGTKDSLLEQIKLDNTGDYYQVVSGGQNKKNGSNYNDAIPATALLVSETYTGSSASIDHDDRKVLVGLSCNEETNLWTLVINAEFYSSGNSNKKWMPTSTDDSAMTSSAFQAQLDKRTSMNVWLAFNLSYEEATSFGDKFYNSGTVGNGITRNVSDPIPKPNGRFDIKVIEIRKQELVQKFRVGNTFHFYGFHHSKRPITTGTAGTDEIKITSDTDDDYDLGDTDFGQFIGDVKEEDDGTFSWYFKYTRPVSRKTGANEASASDTSIGTDSIASFGDFHEEVQWKGSYQDREYSNNRNLLGVYNNRTIGYHDSNSTYLVTGCSFYKDEIRNEFIDRNTGRLNYDVYRYLYRSEINGADDDWYIVSSTEAYDRKRTTLATLTTTGNVALDDYYHKYSTMGTVGGASPSYFMDAAGSPFSTLQDGNGDETTLHQTADRDEHADQTKTLISGAAGASNTATDFSIPTFHSIESVTKRRKTVTVYRKFFVRRPTKDDLQARAFNSPTSDSEKISIYDVMTRTSDPDADADTKLARSFRVIKISKYNYAIEMREVKQSIIHSYDMDNITKILSQETLDTNGGIAIGGTGASQENMVIISTTGHSFYGMLRIRLATNNYQAGDIIHISGWTGSGKTEDGIIAPINGDHIVQGSDTVASSSDKYIYIKVPRVTASTATSSTLGHSGTVFPYKARLCTGYQEIVGGHFRASAGKLEEDLNSTDTFKDPVNGEMN